MNIAGKQKQILSIAQIFEYWIEIPYRTCRKAQNIKYKYILNENNELHPKLLILAQNPMSTYVIYREAKDKFRIYVIAKSPWNCSKHAPTLQPSILFPLKN